MKTGTRPPAFATSSPRRQPRHSGPARRPARLLSQRRRGGPGRTGRPLLQRASYRWAHGRSARRASPPPLGRRRRDRSDGAARRPWRSSRARRSREPRGHPATASPARTPATTSTPGTAWRCSGDKFWLTLAADDPHRHLGADDPALARLHGTGVSGARAGSRPCSARSSSVRRLGLPPGRRRRAARPAARDDDADLAGDHGRLRLQPRGDARLSRDADSGGSWRRWSRSCCSATGSRCARSPRRRAR